MDPTAIPQPDPDESAANRAISEGAAHEMCPDCGDAFDASAIDGPVGVCPRCGSQFFAQTVTMAADEADVADDTNDTREEELDALRIRQLSTLRRVAYRTRSYLIVGVAGGLVFAADLVYYATLRFRHAGGMSPGVIGRLAAVIVCLAASFYFAKKAMSLHREIQADLAAREREEQEIAKNPPDLSQLSDGSQHARNLEKMLGFELHDHDGRSPGRFGT